MTLRTLVCVLALVSPFAAQEAVLPRELMLQPPSELRDPIELYATDRRAVLRRHSISLSEARHLRLAEFYREWARRLAAIDFAALSREGQIDYLLLANRVRYEQRTLEIDAERRAEAAPLLPFAETIVALEEARRRFEEIDPAALARTLHELAETVDEARAALGKQDDDEEEGEEGNEEEAEAAGVDPLVLERAAKGVDELERVLSRWFRFHDRFHPLFSWWVAAPHQEASQALKTYAEKLRDEAGLEDDDDDAIHGQPIGRDALLAELAYEMIPYTPEELIAIAEAEFAWCEAEYRRAAGELGFGEDWKAALEHVKELYVDPGEQPTLVRDLAFEAVDFLERGDLVTVPALCLEVWRMRMMSPERQKYTPFFTGGETVSVAYPTADMSHEEKLMSLRGNNRHFSRAVVHHELIPGHHLQGYMSQRYRTHRGVFRTAFLAEGWALYWELLLWDLDFPRSPEDRIGMLFWRSHRCARIIASLGFHLETLTTGEMVDYLVDRVGHELEGARGEVRRWVSGGYGPLYQCAYMLGGIQLRGLRRELVESGRMTDRAFHDAVLKENAVPIEMIRAALTGQDLQRDFRSAWRFAD